MIMKEKRWLSKFVAMLCVLTMVVGVLTPASVGIAAVTVTKITIQVDDGLTFIDDKGNLMQEEDDEGDDESGNWVANTYKYSYAENTKTITIIPLEGSFNTRRSLKIYCKSQLAPEIAANNGVHPEITAYTSSLIEDANWSISLTLSKATSSEIDLKAKLGSPEYTISFPEDNGYTLKLQEPLNFDSGSHSVTVKENSEIKFKVEPDENNKNKKVTVMAYGQYKDPDEQGLYTIKAIRTTTVNISLDDKTYTVFEPEIKSGKGYLYIKDTASTTITHGNDFRFYVYPQDGYDAPTVKVKTKQENGDFGNEETLTGYNNLYVISNITTDQKIEITSSDIKSYNVLFSSGTGYTIKDTNETNEMHNTSVEYNGDYSFKVVLDKGYTILNVIATSSAGTQVLPATEGNKYTIENVTSDITVTVNVRKESYTIKYPENAREQYSVVQDVTSAGYGDFVIFNVIPEPGNKAPKLIAKYSEISIDDAKEHGVNVNVMSLGDTQYKVEIKGYTVITAEDTGKETRKITFNDKQGYYTFKEIKIDATNVDSVIDEKLTSVSYGSTVKFKIDLHSSCDKSTSYTVTANGAKLNPIGEEYTIEKITENQTIEVIGVEKNKYTVTLQNGDGYTLTTTDSKQVSYGDTFSFSWNVSAGYKKPNGINIEGSAHTDLDSHAGSYGLTGNCSFVVTGNTTVKLDGVTEKNYTVTIGNYDNDNADITIVGQEQPVKEGKLAGIPYDGECSFTVDAADYYQIEYVLYNGRAIEPASNSVYTISNIRSDDNKIEIKTRENILTVNYSGAKYGKAIDAEENTEGSIEITHSNESDIVLKDLSVSSTVANCIYQFDGWTWDGNAKPRASEIKGKDLNLESIKDTDAQINVNAVWKVNTEAVKKGIQVRTGYNSQNVDANVKLTFECILDLIEASIGDEHKSDVKITGYGIIYAATPITSIEGQIEDVKKRKMSLQEGSVYKDRFGENMFNYFINTTLTLDQVQSGNSFRINSVVNKDAKRYGLAWMELTVGDETIIIHGSSAPEQS